MSLILPLPIKIKRKERRKELGFDREVEVT
jgi:hypothetical protein